MIVKELTASQVKIQDSFWTSRLLTNAHTAILHQWQQLEESGCIQNFRLAAGQAEGLREGWFFADSDAYKWLEAAARVYAKWPTIELKKLMDDFIDLVNHAQMEDGYIFTYNQIHFPGERWRNLMIEHELYCHGHLIEAGVSHYEATGEETALKIACKAADLLVRVFLIAPPEDNSGHEEIEIALLRLFQVTHFEKYLELARHFLERRGKVRAFAWLLLQQNARVSRRTRIVKEQRRQYLAKHPNYRLFRLPLKNYARKPFSAKFRWIINTLTGKYFQQHAPIIKQAIPVGHSVRFAYLETAIALFQRLTGDVSLLPTQESAWEHMVTRRMYITGGIGSLPELEGFGRDFELDPEIAYAETCAALGSMFWNWEMALITGIARYSDLFEWQLYNAAAPGMGIGGDSYLYNNPLLSRGDVTRRAWFEVPCCPSNLSRTWAALGKYIYSFTENDLWVHQYIGNLTTIDGGRWTVNLRSGFPWDGKVKFSIDQVSSPKFTVHFRIPSWARTTSISINGEPFLVNASIPKEYPSSHQTASGFDPRLAQFQPVLRQWSPGDTVDLEFEMAIELRHASKRVPGHHHKTSLTRGPLVYCLESIDNPGIDIFRSRINPNSIQVENSPALLGGAAILRGMTADGKEFTAIPYQMWANRGESQMTVWMNT